MTDDWDRLVVEWSDPTHPRYIGVAFAGSDRPRQCSHRHRSPKTALECVHRTEAGQVRLWAEDRKAAGF